MATKVIRRVDDQCRIVIPSHIKKALNLSGGNHVEVTLEDDGTIRIRPTKERCVICGNPVDGKLFVTLTDEPDRKLVCYDCAQHVAKAMLRD